MIKNRATVFEVDAGMALMALGLAFLLGAILGCAGCVSQLERARMGLVDAKPLILAGSICVPAIREDTGEAVMLEIEEGGVIYANITEQPHSEVK